jgi:electron transfer flavoprotein alpha subunit
MGEGLGPVWVISEQGECDVETVSLQLLGKARELADELGVRCETILLGRSLEESARKLTAAGADRLFLADDPTLEFYQPEIYRDIICALARRHRPEIILAGSTFVGRELAPLVAAGLATGLAAHCTGLRLDENRNLEQQVPAYGGLLSIICPEKRPQMATVARGVFKTPEPDSGRKAEIVRIPVPETAEARVKTLEVVRETSSGLQLEEAQVIVAGGAGACSPAGWGTIRELAETMDAALGCTRPVVDEGWAPLDAMIGQSGKMVSPEVYLAIGISGEQQHMVGIAGAKLVVAINNDPASPVFQQVDLGVVENCQEFLPVLIAKIKTHRRKKLTCKP